MSVPSACLRAASRMSSETFCAVSSVFLRMVSRSLCSSMRTCAVLELRVEQVALALEGGELLGHDVQVAPHLVRVEAPEAAGETLPLDVHG